MSAAELRIALLQLAGSGYDREASFEHGLAACHRAAEAGADVALFPELWSTGYSFEGGDLGRWRAQAIARDDPWVVAHADLAAELGMAIAATYLERSPAGPRDAVTLFDRRGREVLSYAKVHTCSFDLPEQALAPGAEFPVARRRVGGDGHLQGHLLGNRRLRALLSVQVFLREFLELLKVQLVQIP